MHWIMHWLQYILLEKTSESAAVCGWNLLVKANLQTTEIAVGIGRLLFLHMVQKFGPIFLKISKTIQLSSYSWKFSINFNKNWTTESVEQMIISGQFPLNHHSVRYSFERSSSKEERPLTKMEQERIRLN